MAQHVRPWKLQMRWGYDSIFGVCSLICIKHILWASIRTASRGGSYKVHSICFVEWTKIISKVTFLELYDLSFVTRFLLELCDMQKKAAHALENRNAMRIHSYAIKSTIPWRKSNYDMFRYSSFISSRHSLLYLFSIKTHWDVNQRDFYQHRVLNFSSNILEM